MVPISENSDSDIQHENIVCREWPRFCDLDNFVMSENNENILKTAFKGNNIYTYMYLRKTYPYDCFEVTIYQSLLMALVCLPFCVL